jgi:putative membrane protein
MNPKITWQAPVFFDPDTLENVDKAATLAYTPAVVLPANQVLEGESAALSMSAAPSEVKEVKENSFVLPAWVKERIQLPQSDAAKEQRARFVLLWLIASLGALVLMLLVVDAYRFIATEFARSWLTGTLFFALIASISVTAAWLGHRAWLDVYRLRTVSALQSEGEKIIQTNGYDHALTYIKKLAHFYAARVDVRPRFERFYTIVDTTYHDREVCTLFSRQVMKELDEQALRVVIKRSNETALLIALSPNPLLSTVLTFWRTQMMVREIAVIYGGRPGFLGMLSLFGLVLQNLLYADVSEMLAESIAETFGGSVLSVFSAQAAQGIGSSLLTARLGLRAMQACRPLPFIGEEKPRLKDVRREIMGSLKTLLGGKKRGRADNFS